MTIKLERRYSEIQTEYDALQEMVTGQADITVIQERLTQLEAKQADLKKTLLHVIVLCKRREELCAVLSK
jgi:DNA repair exonuclease SbcCD ATPase subunit